MVKPRLPYEEAKKQFKRFPVINPKKTVQQNWSESIPLERAERRALSLDSLCRTADRLLIYDAPANKSARGALKSWKQKQKKPARSVIVYLVRFTSKITDEPPFLKIGITNDPAGRFGFDSYRYHRKYLKSSPLLKRAEATDVERRLHRLFADKAYIPNLKLLSKGNSECFIDCDEVLTTTSNLFRLLEEELRSIAPTIKDDQ